MSDGPKKPELKPGMSFAQLQALEKAWHDKLPKSAKDTMMGATMAATIVAAGTAHEDARLSQMTNVSAPSHITEYRREPAGAQAKVHPVVEKLSESETSQEPLLDSRAAKMLDRLKSIRMKKPALQKGAPKLDEEETPHSKALSHLKSQGMIWSLDHQGNSLCPSCAESESKNPQAIAAHKPKKQFIVEPGETCENCGEKS